MAKTLSTMLELGTAAPDFSLPDVVSGKTVSLGEFAGQKALLVMFICRHCPFVKHVEAELARLGADYAHQDVAIVAISANNAAENPDDAPDSLKEMARDLGFNFPFLYDENQTTAKAYAAACTPDFSCSTDPANLSIADSSMIVALTTGSPSPVQTCAEASMRC